MSSNAVADPKIPMLSAEEASPLPFWLLSPPNPVMMPRATPCCSLLPGDQRSVGCAASKQSRKRQRAVLAKQIGPGAMSSGTHLCNALGQG